MPLSAPAAVNWPACCGRSPASLGRPLHGLKVMTSNRDRPCRGAPRQGHPSPRSLSSRPSPAFAHVCVCWGEKLACWGAAFPRSDRGREDRQGQRMHSPTMPSRMMVPVGSLKSVVPPMDLTSRQGLLDAVGVPWRWERCPTPAGGLIRPGLGTGGLCRNRERDGSVRVVEEHRASGHVIACVGWEDSAGGVAGLWYKDAAG